MVSRRRGMGRRGHPLPAAPRPSRRHRGGRLDHVRRAQMVFGADGRRDVLLPASDVVAEAFRAQTSYMPGKTDGPVVDPYTTSVQWSRRFIGLKLFLALAQHGESGYVEMIEHQARMGDVLRESLRRAGWRIVNRTPLPLVCFTRDGLVPSKFLAALYERQIAWMSEVRLGDGAPVVRACVTSFRTNPSDIEWVVREMSRLASLNPRSRREKRNDRHSRRLRGRSDDEGRCRADLSDRRLRVRQRRSWGGPVQSRGRGLSLHPHQQSDDRGAGTARRRPRRRTRRAVRQLGAGGGPLCDAQRDRAGHQHRLGPATLRHHSHAVRPPAAQSRRHRPLRRVGSSRGDRAADRSTRRARSSAKASAIPRETSATSRRWRAWPTSTAFR